MRPVLWLRGRSSFRGGVQNLTFTFIGAVVKVPFVSSSPASPRKPPTGSSCRALEPNPSSLRCLKVAATGAGRKMSISRRYFPGMLVASSFFFFFTEARSRGWRDLLPCQFDEAQVQGNLSDRECLLSSGSRRRDVVKATRPRWGGQAFSAARLRPQPLRIS